MSRDDGAPLVSVVVPYYERPDQLARLLAGLDVQTLAATDFEVVVADDGSTRPPTVDDRAYAVTVVTQADAGFRAAAARNLGARTARGSVLVFLDQDCVPEPDYLEKVASLTDGDWDLTLGRRRHAELDGWGPAAVRAWLTGDGPVPVELDEPQWLLDGYARTLDLTRPDARSYQLVISAVLSVSRALHERLGGFEESFSSYGGEDWDYGHRALVAGAELRHLVDAVVWHDGPDLPGRGDWIRAKNAETLTLAALVPDRDVRGDHLVWAVPDVVIHLDAAGADPASVVASIESLLAGSDAHVWLEGAPALPLEDPRVHHGAPPQRVLDRARWSVRSVPVLLHGTTTRALTELAPVTGDGITVVSRRDENLASRGRAVPRARPLAELGGDGARVERIVSPPVLERLWQGRPRR